MLELWLVRHGQTNWNIDGRIQGQSDVPLNETGRSQAQALTEKLKDVPFVAVYSSDLERARETAEIIAAAHGLAVQIDARLREVKQGEWEGLSLADIRERYDWQYRHNQSYSPDFRPPGGESAREVAERVQAAIEDIHKKHPEGAVLVVSHGLAAATVACRVKGVDLEQVRAMIPNNAEPLCVRWPLTLS